MLLTVHPLPITTAYALGESMCERSRHCCDPRLVLNPTRWQISSPLRGRRGRTVFMVNPAAISSSLDAVAKFIESVKNVLESVEKSVGADCLTHGADGGPCHGFTLMGATPDHGILS